MGSQTSDRQAGTARRAAPAAVKVLIAGGFGVGKTTMVGSISEVAPLRTEEYMTTASVGVDDLDGLEDKATTTVALDFGRVTISRDLVMYLFGTPGQERFWFMWDELSNGALGAIVLADTRRLEDCFEAVDFFESRDINILIAVNEFDGSFHYDPEEVHSALRLKPQVPVVMCDARNPRSATSALVSLVQRLLSIASPTQV
jgi:uncharacterized protein